jgi:DNA-binding protein HU-beta
LNKADIVREVARAAGVSTAEAAAAVDALLASVVDALERGERVEIPGLGSFERGAEQSAPEQSAPG